eukprot:TRINITY_DN1670_c0_g3_i2.p1 TRINITY_DN1670_c0_g3~~TRINITY_DN1670_c0_g3_i2.p1  ORF type:complete len:1182 (+),score=405.20 TRINITY_DN1670_c0_g3_i2:87-3632(+)
MSNVYVAEDSFAAQQSGEFRGEEPEPTGQAVGFDVGFDGAADREEGCLKRVISVQLLVVLLCIMGIAASGVSAAMLSNRSCDNALTNTRASSDRGNDQCFVTAADTLEATVLDMIRPTVVTLTELLNQYVEITTLDMSRLKVMNAVIHGARPKTYSYLKERLPDLWLMQYSHGPEPLLRGTGVYAGNAGVTIHRTKEAACCDYMTLTSEPSRLPYTEAGYTTPLSGEIYVNPNLLPEPAIIYPFYTMPNNLEGVQLCHERYIAPGETKFGSVSVISRFIGYMVTMNVPDPTLSTPTGTYELMVYIDLRNIDNFLKGLPKKACELQVDKSIPCPEPVYYTAVRSSWIAAAKKARNASDWAKYDQAGMLMGASRGDSASLAIGVDSMTGWPNQTIPTMLYDVDAPDVTISSLAKYINALPGGYEQVHNTNGGFIKAKVNVNGTDTDYFMGVTRFNNTELGVDWWLVSAYPAAPILGPVMAEQDKQRAVIQAERDSVAAEIDEDQMIAQIITAAVALALIILSIGFAQSMLKPIKDMQMKMQDVACMNLDSADELQSNSAMYEVRAMQRDFVVMVKNLLEYRAYVPEAVLSNGEKPVDPPTGTVAIMFTDIKGSTSLWKMSANDMNTAMEIHNDCIRGFYKAHKAYEVKTIGDAFMCSFADPMDAVAMALRVQKELAAAPWHSSCPGLDLPDAGVVIRIGVNYGPVIAEQNPVTGRVDYRGSTVNMASRLESNGFPGCTCISNDVLAAIKPKMDRLPGNPVVHDFGEKDLKGLGMQQLYLINVAEQKNRFVESTSDCYNNDAVPKKDRRGSDIASLTHVDGLGLRQNTHPDGSQHDDVHSVMTFGTQLTNAVLQGARKTGLVLVKASVTAVVCKLFPVDSQPFESVNMMVRLAGEAATATDGVVGPVTGRTLTVFWNASKRCKQHVMASMRFVAQIQRRTAGFLKVGIGSGTMHTGNVGTQKQRFATTFGPPLEAAEAMADLADTVGSFCFFSDCTSEARLAAEPSVQDALRLVDVWFDVSEYRRMHIFELDVDTFRTAMEQWGMEAVLSPAEEDPLAMTAVKFSGLVRAVITDGVEKAEASYKRLTELAAQEPTRLNKFVVEILKGHGQGRYGYRARANFAKLPYSTVMLASEQYPLLPSPHRQTPAGVSPEPQASPQPSPQPAVPFPGMPIRTASPANPVVQ